MPYYNALFLDYIVAKLQTPRKGQNHHLYNQYDRCKTDTRPMQKTAEDASNSHGAIRRKRFVHEQGKSKGVDGEVKYERNSSTTSLR